MLPFQDESGGRNDFGFVRVRCELRSAWRGVHRLAAAHSRAHLDVVIASSQDPSAFASRFERSFGDNPRISLEFRRFDVFPTPSKLTLDTYLRFWVDELMPGRERAIYL